MEPGTQPIFTNYPRVSPGWEGRKIPELNRPPLSDAEIKAAAEEAKELWRANVAKAEALAAEYDPTK